MASHFGGTRNGTIVHWPKGVEGKGELRTQFHHVIDVAPTILEIAGLPQPAFVNGVQQHPIEGVRMATLRMLVWTCLTRNPSMRFNPFSIG